MILQQSLTCFVCILIQFVSIFALDNDVILSDFRGLQQQVNALSKELIETKTDLVATKQKLQMTQEEVTHLKNKDRARRLAFKNETSSNAIMFTAQLINHAEHLGEGQTIKFTGLVTNIGSGYDPVTGVFTCPEAGKYFFIVTIMSHYENWIETQLKVNGIQKMLIYSGGGSSAGTTGVYNQGTTSIILDLNAGDRIWVETLNTQLVHGIDVHVYGGGWSSFSGFRISI